MRAHGAFPAAILGLALSVPTVRAAASQVSELQTRFDQETNADAKAKLMEKLGEAELAETREAGKAGDHARVAEILEKYGDNVRVTFAALKKQHPDTDRHADRYYRHFEIQVRRAIREVDESLLRSPQLYQPPIQIVRADLVAIDNELLHILFPQHTPPPASPAAPTPGPASVTPSGKNRP
jgi:hypothetical protein